MWVLLMRHDSEEPIMQAITTIGLDIAKSVFQVHGIDVEGNVIIRRHGHPTCTDECPLSGGLCCKTILSSPRRNFSSRTQWAAQD
jgi:hypothetical protein